MCIETLDISYDYSLILSLLENNKEFQTKTEFTGDLHLPGRSVHFRYPYGGREGVHTGNHTSRGDSSQQKRGGHHKTESRTIVKGNKNEGTDDVELHVVGKVPGPGQTLPKNISLIKSL